MNAQSSRPKARNRLAKQPGLRRGPKPQPIVEFPEPLAEWSDPPGFGEALTAHMSRHGDTIWHLHRAVSRTGESFDRTTIREWCAGRKAPRSATSLRVLERIEHRYRLPEGYFRAKFAHPGRATTGQAGSLTLTPSERRRIAWHLPDDFDQRPPEQRSEIVDWVRRVIISGCTDYRRYQCRVLRDRFSLRFPNLAGHSGSPVVGDPLLEAEKELDRAPVGVVDAPVELQREMEALVRFKTATLTQVGLERLGKWKEVTAQQKVEHLGLLFGALTAPPGGAVNGLGVPSRSLGLGLLVFPATWDWYARWREERRGFYTSWEVNMLQLATALTRRQTGWLRQHPEVLSRLRPIEGLVTPADLQDAVSDWDNCCDRVFAFAKSRSKEIERVARVHRDPFEPIMPILEAASPVGEYRRITEEIARLMPDEKRHPRPGAEAVRSFLMLRFGLHLGLRQKNLRELLFCPRGRKPTSERLLQVREVGELRWDGDDASWEVLLPASAFKNSGSSFFGKCSLRLSLPDLGGLYRFIEEYAARHREVLLANATDPGTFFVKTVKASTRSAAYSQAGFYDAWRLAIQRYGIFNPFTGRGAISGLLPHGPHNVRDVLATHVLKQTGSYEQASYAIHDTPDMVAKHYGRFLPRDKAAMAAKVLNLAWAEA